MKIVRTIKRIIALDKANRRIPTGKAFDDNYFALWEKICDKRETLSSDIKNYINFPDDRKDRHIRRKCVKLACNILNVDYYSIIR